MRLERLRQRAARPHAIVHVVSTDLKNGLLTRRRRMSSDCTSGMPALSSVASSWLKTRNSRVAIRERVGRAQGAERQPPGALDRKDVQAFLLELAAQPVFAVGDVDAFDDFPARGAEPAAELHA